MVRECDMRIKHCISLLLILSSTAYAMHKYSIKDDNFCIVDYDDNHHREELKKLIRENKSFLFANPEFPIDSMLKLKTVTPDVQKSHGTLCIKVAYQENMREPITGFIGYSFPDAHTLVINLLAIQQQYRRMGHAQELFDAALNEGIQHGITQWSVSTRKTNTAAHELYKKLGDRYKKNNSHATFIIEEQKISLSNAPYSLIDIIVYHFCLMKKNK